ALCFDGDKVLRFFVPGLAVRWGQRRVDGWDAGRRRRGVWHGCGPGGIAARRLLRLIPRRLPASERCRQYFRSRRNLLPAFTRTATACLARAKSVWSRNTVNET